MSLEGKICFTDDFLELVRFLDRAINSSESVLMAGQAGVGRKQALAIVAHCYKY
jgi:hypothetical protein